MPQPGRSVSRKGVRRDAHFLAIGLSDKLRSMNPGLRQFVTRLETTPNEGISETAVRPSVACPPRYVTERPRSWRLYTHRVTGGHRPHRDFGGAALARA